MDALRWIISFAATVKDIIFERVITACRRQPLLVGTLSVTCRVTLCLCGVTAAVHGVADVFSKATSFEKLTLVSGAILAMVTLGLVDHTVTVAGHFFHLAKSGWRVLLRQVQRLIKLLKRTKWR